MRRRISSVVLAQTQGGLQPEVKRKTPGKTYLSFILQRIGLKHAQVFQDPFFTITVRSKIYLKTKILSKIS